jgi:hypothetical protein
MSQPANHHGAASDDGRTVTIDVRNHRARITGADLEPALISALVADACQVRTKADGQVVAVHLQKKFFRQESDNTWVFPAGLLETVVAQLERDGFRVTVEDRTGLPTISPDQRAGFLDEELDDFELAIVKAVAISPRGHFPVRSVEDALDRAAMLCRLWSNKRILLIARNKRLAKQAAAQLRSLIPRAVGTTDDLDAVWRMENWLLVMEVQSFAKIGPPSDQWNVIIFLDTALVLGAKAFRHARRMKNSLRYGFTLPGKPNDKLAGLMIRSVFGPPIQDEPNPAPAVEVWFATTPLTPQPKYHDPLERKRRAIWHNAARNRALAEIASALVHHDLACLWQYGLLLNEDESWFDGRHKVCLLVESLEHARELAKLLPEWTIRDATVPNPERWTNEDTNHMAIKTAVCAHEDGLYTDLLIRADGTASPWTYIWGPAVTREKRIPRDLVMIDLRDDFNAHAEADTQTRARGYLNRGWTTSHAPTIHKSKQEVRREEEGNNGPRPR